MGIILIRKNVEAYVTNQVLFSYRLILLDLKGDPIKSEIELERFYKDLIEPLRMTKFGKSTNILGNFNLEVGRGRVENIDAYGLGIRNDGETDSFNSAKKRILSLQTLGSSYLRVVCTHGLQKRGFEIVLKYQRRTLEPI